MLILVFVTIKSKYMKILLLENVILVFFLKMGEMPRFDNCSGFVVLGSLFVDNPER